MDKLINAYELPKLSWEVTNHLNRSITSHEIEAVLKRCPIKKGLPLYESTTEVCLIFEE
jgi:hypothetical protein